MGSFLFGERTCTGKATADAAAVIFLTTQDLRSIRQKPPTCHVKLTGMFPRTATTAARV